MKRLLRILSATIVVFLLAVAGMLIPKFRNMRAEYATARAIQELKEFVETHKGEWPTSPADFAGRYPVGGDVYIDYSATSERLIEGPDVLREAIRPRSGRFYTYPHYAENIAELHATLQKKSPSEPQR